MCNIWIDIIKMTQFPITHCFHQYFVLPSWLHIALWHSHFPHHLWLSWKVPLLKAHCLLLHGSIFAETPTNDQRRSVIKSVVNAIPEFLLLHTFVCAKTPACSTLYSENIWATCNHIMICHMRATSSPCWNKKKKLLGDDLKHMLITVL